MTDTPQSPPPLGSEGLGSEGPGVEDARIGELFDGVAKRATPSAQALELAKTESAAVWQEVVAQQRQQQRKRWSGLAVAATVLFAVATVTLLRSEGASTNWDLRVSMGQLEVQESVAGLGSELAQLDIGPQQLADGTRIRATQNTRLLLASGAEIRLAQNTNIRLLGPSRFELSSGRVYIDTHERADMTVVTTLGEVADIGTQYSVDQTAAGLNIAVRSGSAVLRAAGKSYQVDADATSAGIIDINSDGQVNQRQEPKSASRWDWIHTAASGYASRDLSQVLEQIAADLGVELKYASVGDQAALANVTYAGDLSQMQPLQALELLGLSSDLRWTLDAHTLSVRVNP